MNKPAFSYEVNINKGEILLASYAVKNQTTKYGGFTDAAVNLQISAFKWDAEDEPRDINLIAKTITEEIAEIGD